MKRFHFPPESVFTLIEQNNNQVFFPLMASSWVLFFCLLRFPSCVRQCGGVWQKRYFLRKVYSIGSGLIIALFFGNNIAIAATTKVTKRRWWHGPEEPRHRNWTRNNGHRRGFQNVEATARVLWQPIIWVGNAWEMASLRFFVFFFDG